MKHDKKLVIITQLGDYRGIFKQIWSLLAFLKYCLNMVYQPHLCIGRRQRRDKQLFTDSFDQTFTVSSVQSCILLCPRLSHPKKLDEDHSSFVSLPSKLSVRDRGSLPFFDELDYKT